MNTKTIAVVSQVKKLASLVLPSITTAARVRFDSDAGKWGIVKPAEMEHFDYAIMRNVSFSNQVVQGKVVGCGGHRADDDYLGFAEGELFLGKHSISIVGLRALSFDRHNGQFHGTNGATVSNASYLYLQPNRHAFYTE